MNLAELLKSIETESVSGSTQMGVSGIAFNSREVKPGNVFVCITGFETDGHKYIPDAIERGASAIIAEKDVGELGVTCVRVKNSRYALARMSAAYYDYPYRRFKLIGITGTNGKTTTTYLVKSVLESLGKKVGLIGTNQNMIGEESVPSKHTTPDALELMQLFRKMADSGAEYVVMEVSSHSLALDRVTACKFDVGGFTNITQDHLDFHKSMQEYLEAKAKLFKICKSGAVNRDDSASGFLIGQAECETLITYGVSSDCDLRASDVELSASGVRFDASFEGETKPVELCIPGMFSVYNALTAISCLVAAGIPFWAAAAGMKNARGVKGRIEVVPVDRDYTVIIDYAHTPDGLLNIINTIRGFATARIITVFGCGGDRDAGKRPKMGRIASELSDLCVVTSDNPRSEDPGKIIEDILTGVKEGGGDYVVVPNRFSAIEYALDHAQKNDIILLAGKGHETYQILAGGRIHFDEREIVHKLLEF